MLVACDVGNTSIKLVVYKNNKRIAYLRLYNDIHLDFDEELNEFDSKLKRYTIDTLGLMMKKFYQERELSKVNKRISIVSKDLSIDGSNGSKTATLNELEKVSEELDEMIYKQTPSAYDQEVSKCKNGI